jgi:hypothetical protein
MHEEFKEQYQKMRDPDFNQETVFKPPKPYFFFGENIVLIDEKEAAEISGLCLNSIQQRARDGDITRIKVEKENHSKYYFLKHECERIANEKKEKGF